MSFSPEGLYFAAVFFVFYAFIGWCLEVSYFAVDTGRFVNRGFLNGPVCPVYGFGVLIVLLALEPVSGNLLLLFLGSVLLTSALELLTGYALEKLFNTRWWDYSHLPFNLGGYICLKNSLLWGMGCVFVVKLVHPLVKRLAALPPRWVGVTLVSVLVAVLLGDFVASVVSVARLNVRLRAMDELSVRLRRQSDALGENLSEEVLELRDRYEKLMDKRSVVTARLLRAFPGMRSLRFGSLEELRERLEGRRKGKG